MTNLIRFPAVVIFIVLSVLSAGCGAVSQPNQTGKEPPRSCSGLKSQANTSCLKKIPYPSAREDSTVDIYQGSLGKVEVKDPYRWMENDSSTEVTEFIKSQNALTGHFLGKIPQREEIRKSLTKNFSYERFGMPVKNNGKYFFLKNTGKQNQAVLYVQNSLAGAPSVLVDPNPMASDGTTAIDNFNLSEDGRFIAIAFQEKGTDWRRWKVLEVASKKFLEDEILWSKYTTDIQWDKHSKGFYYSRFPQPDSGGNPKKDQKIYYHLIGTDQAKDLLVYERPQNPDWWLDVVLAKDGRHLLIGMESVSGETAYLIKELPAGEFKELLPLTESQTAFLGSKENLFYFNTDLDAPNGKIISVDIDAPAERRIKTVVPETTEATLSARFHKDKIVVNYLKDVHSQVRIFDLNGKWIRDVEFPETYVTASGFNTSDREGETFYSFQSYLTPPSLYRYNLNTGESALFLKPTLDFDSSGYETKQVFFTSKDKTRVPMFITAKKGIRFDGNNRVILYGYGGFNIAQQPGLNPFVLTWLERGGVFAVANLRGGSEYGETWHKAGTKLNKQNVFDDFIAAAEYLIAQGYTTSKQLAIRGGSNGGLLVGACLLQRPDLFGAALPEVGVMDMLRFNKFTAGVNWVDDYGSPEPLPSNPDHWDAREFDNLLNISPYHFAMRNWGQRISYPPTLITTGDHDDRVVPMHSFKFAAALQKAQGGDAPILLRVETNAGHGSGMPLSKRIGLAVDQIGFLEEALLGNILK